MTTTPNETCGWWTRLVTIQARLDDKVAIVTGANTGIGKHTAAELARRGAKVIMACRSEQRAKAAKKDILAMYAESNAECLTKNVASREVVSSLSPVKEDQLIIELLDLGSLASVRQFVYRISSKFESIDFLINNAGLADSVHTLTADGFERTIAVNHIGHFYLTQLLTPLLEKKTSSSKARVILVSSDGHRWGQLVKPDLQLSPDEYGAIRAYAQSKLANVMHARWLAQHFDDKFLSVSIHPGVVETEIGRNLDAWYWSIIKFIGKPYVLSAWQGSQTTLYALLTSDPQPGGYYSNCRLVEPSASAMDDGECQWLVECTESLISKALDK